MDLACLERELTLRVRVQVLGFAQAQQLIGQAQDDEARIRDDREQHLAQRFRLRCRKLVLGAPLRRQPDAAELAQFAGEAHSLSAEAGYCGALFEQAGIEQRDGQRGEDHVVIDRERCDDPDSARPARAPRRHQPRPRAQASCASCGEHRGGGGTQGGSRCFHGRIRCLAVSGEQGLRL